MMQNNINNSNSENKKINRTNNERPVKRYGMPACGGGKLVGNTYVPPVKTRPAVKVERKAPVVDEATNNRVADTEAVVNSELKANEADNIVLEAVDVNSEEPKNRKENFKVSKKIGGWFKKVCKGIVTTFTTVEAPAAHSVRAGEKSGKFPLSRVILVGLMVVLLMFVIIDYVKIFENNQMISELKNQLEDYTEEEKKLSSQLAEQYDIVDIGEYASEELGMVSGENQIKVYVDVSEDESIEGYDVPTEDYGAIATIMNALGQSARAWLEIFGG